MKKLLNLDKDHFLLTDLDSDHPQSVEMRGRAILTELQRLKTSYQDRRRAKSDRMLESWGIYFNSEEAVDYLRNAALGSNGTPSIDWQHKIQDGLGFRTIETVVSYLMGAFFPNQDWFDITPQMSIDDEEYLMYLKVMKGYIHAKMKQSHVRERVECFLRQVAICGTSCLALPWRFETKQTKRNVVVRNGDNDSVEVQTEEKILYNHPELEVLDIFEFWLDPDNSDPNDASFVRRIVMSRGEILRLVRDGYYDLADVEDVRSTKSANINMNTPNKVDVDIFGGITSEIKANDKVEVFEFWGTIATDDYEYQDVVATWCGDTLLRFETNPYWCGRPFVFATYTPVVSSPYGIGALEPIRGLIHEKNSIKNQRLDAGALSLNPMYEFVNDGTFDASSFYTEPGRMIPVSTLGGTMRPIQFDRGYHSISVNEEQSLGADIEMTTGTGAFVGQSQGRSGERVTAQEIQAQRDAGGNRLSSTHSHLEEQFLVRLLTRYYQLCQQFQIEEEIVPVPGNSSEEMWYAKVGIEQLGIDFYFSPTGATHVADKEYDLRNMLDWVAAVNQVPEMAQSVNWAEVVKELTKRFLRQNVERFLQKPPEPQAPEAPPMGVDPAMMAGQDPISAAAGQIGGAEMAQYIASQEQAAPGMLEASLAATGTQNALPLGANPEAVMNSLAAPPQ